MDTNYCFAVYVDAEQMPESIIGTIGKRKSAFLFEAKGNKENDLIPKVEDAFFQEKSTWYYALSDVVVNNDYELDTFSVIDCKQIRNVSTSYKEKSVRKSNIQYSLIKAGSVFFKKNPIKYENENCSQIGYNHIIKIGGE